MYLLYCYIIDVTDYKYNCKIKKYQKVCYKYKLYFAVTKKNIFHVKEEKIHL